MSSVGVIIPWREGDFRRKRNLDWCELRWRHILGGSASIVFGKSPDGPFNRSAAVNNGRKQLSTDADVIVVADADTHGDVDAIAAAVDSCREDHWSTWILPYTRYYNLTDECSERIISGSSGRYISESELDYEHRITSPAVPPYGDPVSGIFVLPIQAFDYVGGFDESYVGWGYEDRDMAIRLDSEWGERKRLDSFVFHLWHPVTQDPFQTPEAQENARRFRAFQSRHPGV